MVAKQHPKTKDITPMYLNVTENISLYFTLVNCRKLPELLPSTNQNSREVKKAVIDAKSGNITIGVATVGSVAED